MQNFSLENHHMMNARQPLCWRMTQIRFFPTPYVADHLTFVEEGEVWMI